MIFLFPEAVGFASDSVNNIMKQLTKVMLRVEDYLLVCTRLKIADEKIS